MAVLVVIDAGTILSSLLPDEPLRSQARQLFTAWERRGTPIAAPVLFRYEVIAVIRKAVYQKRVPPLVAEQFINEVLARPIAYHLDDDLLRRAYALATLYNRPTAYDAQYLAVAERLGCDFWTADERLYNAVKGALAWVKWLGQGGLPSAS